MNLLIGSPGDVWRVLGGRFIGRFYVAIQGEATVYPGAWAALVLTGPHKGRTSVIQDTMLQDAGLCQKVHLDGAEDTGEEAAVTFEGGPQ